MRYVSPVWLFNGQWPGNPDRKALVLRRTQLLAELELTGITIEYHGETLTKNDELYPPPIGALGRRAGVLAGCKEPHRRRA